MTIIRTGGCLFLLLLLLSCGGGKGDASGELVGDTLEMFHSRLLTIVDCTGYSIVDIKNPWGNGLLHRYLLVPENSPIPTELPSGTLLRTPLDRMLVFSTVHVSLMNTLGCLETVKGVCDARYIRQPDIKRRIACGEIVDCGSSLDVDAERVVQLSPDAVLVLPFENGGYGKMDKLPYPLVECAEYMEASPLAEAEWIRFYGRLVGRASLADSLFAVVCCNYDSLATLVKQVEKRPTLMCELKSSSAWYVPSGESTMGQMYKVAGADYLFADGKGGGSRPLSFETLLARAANADIWLFKYNSATDKTYSSLLADFSGYSHFKPFKERNVFACNLARKDFYEETPFRPDYLLAELIALFHPAILPDHKLRYYEKMEE